MTLSAFGTLNPRERKNLILDIYDLAFLVGNVITFSDWKRVVCPELCKKSAQRRWDRFRNRLRRTTLDIQYPRQRNDNGKGGEERRVEFPSVEYMKLIAKQFMPMNMPRVESHEEVLRKFRAVCAGGELAPVVEEVAKEFACK